MKKKLIFILPIILLLILAGAIFLKKVKLPFGQTSSVPKDKYVAFTSEVYDKIKENYWDKLTDEQLTNVYVLATEKLTNQPQPSKAKTKEEMQKMVVSVLKEINDEQKKKEYVTQLADMVLANLQPFGRSRLYSQKQEVDLKNRVENRNPEVDNYKVLDVTKDASADQIKQSFEQKNEALATEINKEIKPEVKQQKEQELAQVKKAFQTLSDTENRKVYDQSGIEPTIENRFLTPEIFYIHLTKFSPTTVDELLRVTQKVDQGETLNTLIFDLRDNVGGSIDGLPYFLGPFIGNDQYAYQFFHQGNKEDFKTKIGWLPSLVRYKRVVVLINGGTQSSAEVMAAVLKKFNVGILVGTKTRGWGTVEKVFDISQQIDPSEKYSVFLVHRLTLREDGQPIEGKGVEPVINIEDKNWENELYKYFRFPALAQAIKEIYRTK